MEEQVVRQATALVFVTEEARDLVMAKYPQNCRRKAFVVPHGFDPRVQDNGGRTHDVRGRAGIDRPIRLVHTGRFYTGQRTPVALLRALADLNKGEPLHGTLEILLVGPHVQEFARDAEALGVTSLVTFRGRVVPAEAADLAAEADVLLVIDASSNGPSVFLPSKLVDYLAFRKPILGITPEQGASARLLQRLGCPIAAPDDPPAIMAALADLIIRARAGALSVSGNFDSVAAEYDIRRTTELLHQVLLDAFRA
jgi:hypothetical protein